jgi:integrase
MKANRQDKITKRTVDAAKPEGGRFIIWDTELKGFGLLVLPTGVKSYCFNYVSPADSRERRATIGKHGDWTPMQARDKAEDLRDAVRRGEDPLSEKRAARDAASVNQLLDAYLASEAFAGKAPSTQYTDRGRIDRHLRPLIGKRVADSLTAEDIKRAMRAIRDGKTATSIKTKHRGRAIVRGGAGTAKKAVMLLGAVYTWAAREGLSKINPCRDIEKPADAVRDLVLDPEHYAAMFATLTAMEARGDVRPAVADAVRFIALTGCRRGEATGLKWKHVELDAGRVVLPPEAHKTGHGTGKAREIALPVAALAIIARQQHDGADAFVFGRRSGKLDLSKDWRRVSAEAKLPPAATLHSLRHSVGTHLALAGAGASEIMQTLGHRQLSTAQKYIHWGEQHAAKHALAERAAAVAVTAMAPAEKGKVVSIKKGRRHGASS